MISSHEIMSIWHDVYFENFEKKLHQNGKKPNNIQ